MNESSRQILITDAVTLDRWTEVTSAGTNGTYRNLNFWLHRLKRISYILVDLWTDKSTKPTLFLLICGQTKLYTWLKTRTCTKTRWSIPTYHISIKSTRLTTTEIREGRAGVCRDSIACYYSTIVLPHGQVPQFTNWCVDVPPKRKSCIDSRTRICWKTHYPLVKHRTTHCEMVQALELQIF